MKYFIVISNKRTFIHFCHYEQCWQYYILVHYMAKTVVSNVIYYIFRQYHFDYFITFTLNLFIIDYYVL